jgi:hypothetical protein
MGRRRWTNRLTVEECCSFDIAELVRAGALPGDPRALCSTTWTHSSGSSMQKVTFRVLPGHTRGLVIHVYHSVPATLYDPARIQQQSIPIATTACNFGGVRYWFRCPLIRDGYPCRIRGRVLYATPHERLFGCRKCHNLTYESVQKHDKRIDQLLKLPLQDFNHTLATGTLRQRLLAVQASTERFRRTQRSAQRMLNSGRRSNGSRILQNASFGRDLPSNSDT